MKNEVKLLMEINPIVPEKDEKYLDYIQRIRQMREDRKYEFVYMERHHIVLRSKGGSNKKENLIWLLAQEHYYAHKVLYQETKDNKTACAWWSMSNRIHKTKKRIVVSANEYAQARMAICTSQSKPVICLETGEEFLNAVYAAQHIGCKDSIIYAICGNTMPNLTAKRFHFLFKEDYTEEKKNFLLSQKSGVDKIKQEVVCVETGEIFNSITDAAKFVNRNESNIRAVLYGRIETCGKDENGKRYHWKYLDETKNGKLRKVKKPWKIRCLETGEVFDRVSDACRELEINYNSLSGHLQRHGKSCISRKNGEIKRFTFEYIKGDD